MTRISVSERIYSAIESDNMEELKNILHGRKRRITWDMVHLATIDGRLEALKLFRELGTSMGDAFSVAAVHGHFHICKWFAYETDEKFPIEFQFETYDNEEVNAWVQHITMRDEQNHRTVARDLLHLAEDPIMNSGQKKLICDLAQKYWPKYSL